MAEQDAEVRVGVRAALGVGAARAIRDGIDAHELHAPAAQLELDRVVAEQMRGREVFEPARRGERVARVAEVVVSEHGVRAGPEPPQQLTELGLASRMRQQVAGQQDEVGLAFLDPRHRPLDSPPAPGRHAEVEVGEVRDAQAVELGR